MERQPAPPRTPLAIIAGPTGAGKSALALRLADRLPAEIIAADSMQVRRGFDVGTGKPSLLERRAVPHHLVDVCGPADEFSAGEFAARAHAAAAAIRSRERVPILVGGTGLYLRAFLKGRLGGTGADPAIRSRLRRQAETEGCRALHDRLGRLDPATADRIHPGDLLRTVRALELWERTGQPPSTMRPDLWEPPRIPVSLFLVLDRERTELYRLIDQRARRMWEGGLLEEVGALLAAGYPRSLRALQALGYRQALAHLEGRLTSEEALHCMQRATRNYAKRQLTWFRRETAAEWRLVRGWDWVEPLAEELAGRLSPSPAGRLDPLAASMAVHTEGDPRT